MPGRPVPYNSLCSGPPVKERNAAAPAWQDLRGSVRVSPAHDRCQVLAIYRDAGKGDVKVEVTGMMFRFAQQVLKFGNAGTNMREDGNLERRGSCAGLCVGNGSLACDDEVLILASDDLDRLLNWQAVAMSVTNAYSGPLGTFKTENGADSTFAFNSAHCRAFPRAQIA